MSRALSDKTTILLFIFNYKYTFHFAFNNKIYIFIYFYNIPEILYVNLYSRMLRPF